MEGRRPSRSQNPTRSSSMLSDRFTALHHGGGEPPSQHAVCCGERVADLLPGYPCTGEPNPVLASDVGTQQPGCPGAGGTVPRADTRLGRGTEGDSRTGLASEQREPYPL